MSFQRYTRRRFLSRALRATTAFTTAAALVSCGLFQTETGNVSPTAGTAPGGDRTLYLYGWATYVDNREVMDGFTRETGIRVVGDAYDSNEVMVAKLEAAGGQAGYSIIYPSDYMVAQMRDRELLIPLDKSRLTNLGNLDPQYLDPPYDPGSQFSLPVSLGTTGIAYNIDAVKKAVGEEPTTWQYLWKYRDRLRLSLLNDPREVLGMAMHILGYGYNATEEDQIRAAFEKLSELRSAIVKFDTDAWREALIAGDYTLCMAFSGDGISVAREHPNVKYILPADGTSIWTDTIAIPRGAPDPDAAYAWIDYVLRPDVAAKICNANSFGTTNKLALPLVDEDLKDIPAWVPSADIVAKSGRLSRLPPEVLQVYETYWTRLTSGLA